MGKVVNVDEVVALGGGPHPHDAWLSVLDERGFVVVPGLLDVEALELLRGEFERAIANDPEAAAHELGTRRTTVRHDDAAFSVCWRHRVVLDAARHLLGASFQIGDVDLRDPKKDRGEQRLHPDHGETPVPGLTVTWYLDDFSIHNGATRILPGSHRRQPPPPWPIPGTEDPVPGEEVATGPAGSVLLRDARLFHGGGRNATDYPRRSALVFFQHDIPDTA